MMSFSQMMKHLCKGSGNRFVKRLITESNISKYSTQLQPENLMNKEELPNPLDYDDYFKVRELVRIREMFEARVHYGHKIGLMDSKMKPYIFGSRLDHLIFDLQKTAECLRDALNFMAHIAYRGGIILFVSNAPLHCRIIEKTAMECREFAHCRSWRSATFTNSSIIYGGTIRLPDLCIVLNTMNKILEQHPVISQAAKMNIPTVGVVDSNCDPTLITYPIPGNDDSLDSISYYCGLMKEAILRGKAERAKYLEVVKNHDMNFLN